MRKYIICHNAMKLFFYFLILAMVFPSRAHAYIDPGAGSYLFQIIAASLITVLFTARKILKFLRSLIKKIISLKQKDL